MVDQTYTPVKAEKMFINRAKFRGWHVLRAGWPDYMLTRKTKAGGMEFLAVEVKNDHSEDRLRDTQQLMLAALVLQGVPVSIWSAETQMLRKMERLAAQETMDNYFASLERENVRTGLHELRKLGVNVRYDI